MCAGAEGGAGRTGLGSWDGGGERMDARRSARHRLRALPPPRLETGIFPEAWNKPFSVLPTGMATLSGGSVSASAFWGAWLVRNLESTTGVQMKENKKKGDDARNFL